MATLSEAPTCQVPAARKVTASRWIISPWGDWLFLIAAPLAIVPLVTLSARHLLAAEEIALFVVAFATLGHHLPGFLRAYGDRELFLRFRARFILAPLLILGVAYEFATLDLHGLALIVMFWGTWHGLMQTYGFMRIYDFKQGVADRSGARLDFALCLSLFATGLILSDARVYGMADVIGKTGLEIPTRTSLVALRWLAVMATGLVGLFYVYHLWKRFQAGVPIAWPRLALAASTGWLYWLAGTLATDMLIGVAMFEIFHAVQYDAIVWAFNRSRATKNQALWRPLAMVFAQGRWASLGIYAALIGSFGALRLFGEQIIDLRAQVWLLALVTTSTILHYYFDGFIWKVSDRKTQADLAIAERNRDETDKRSVFPWFHAGGWLLFCLMIIGLGFWENQRRTSLADESQNLAKLVALTPDLPELQWRVSNAALLANDPQRAVDAAEHGVQLRPHSQQAYARLGVAKLEAGDWPAAVEAFRTASRLAPRLWKNHSNLAIALSHVKAWNEADKAFATALKLNPQAAVVQAAWTKSYAMREDPLNTIEHGKAALALDPQDNETTARVAEALIQTNQAPAAQELLQNRIAQNAQVWQLIFVLGNLQSAEQDYAAAAKNYRRVLDIHPSFAPALINLASMQWLQGDLVHARKAYEQALSLEPNNGSLHYNLGMLLTQLGEQAAAQVHLERAKELGVPELK